MPFQANFYHMTGLSDRDLEGRKEDLVKQLEANLEDLLSLFSGHPVYIIFNLNSEELTRNFALLVACLF